MEIYYLSSLDFLERPQGRAYIAFCFRGECSLKKGTMLLCCRKQGVHTAYIS